VAFLLQRQVAQLQQREVSRPLAMYRLRFGRHTDGVQQVSFSPDGSHVVSASLDHTAKLWNLATGLVEKTFTADGPLNAAVFLPSTTKNLLALGSESGSVRLIDWNQTSVVKEWRFGSAVYALAFDPAGETLACGGKFQEMQFYPVGKGSKQALTWKSPVNALLYLPTRDLVLADDEGHVQRIHDNRPARLSESAQRVVALAASRDGQMLASGGEDRIVRVFDASGKALYTLAGNTSAVWSVAISPDKKLVASGAVDGTIRLWETEKGSQVATLVGPVDTVTSLAFDDSGKTLLSAGQETSIRVWDVASRQQVNSLEGEWAKPKTVQFSADLTIIVTEGSKDKTQLWSGSELAQEFDESVTAIAISRDGRTIALGNRDGTVTIRPDLRKNPKVEQPVGTLAAFDGPVRGVVFNGNGNVIAVESSDAKTVRVMDVRPDPGGGRHDTTHELHEEQAWFVALDESGHSVALAGRRYVAIFNRSVPGSQPVKIKSDIPILGIAYNVFGQLMILHEDQSVDLVVNGGTRHNRLPGASKVKSVLAAISEDGRSLAFTGTKGEISVWTPWGAQPLHVTAPGPLRAVAFSRDGKRLGTLDETGTVRTYSVGPAAAQR
jgi:WD40 repeat protein